MDNLLKDMNVIPDPNCKKCRGVGLWEIDASNTTLSFTDSSNLVKIPCPCLFNREPMTNKGREKINKILNRIKNIPNEMKDKDDENN